MVVTEFALLKLKVDPGDTEFQAMIREATEIQDQWIQQHQPHLLEDKPYQQLSNFFLFSSTPGHSTLLITAPWDSADGHWTWINSDENKFVFGKLSKYLSSEDDPTLILHMKPACPVDPELRGDLFAKETPFNVIRLTCKRDEMQWLQQWFRGLIGQAKDLKPNARVWGGWRVEEDDDSEDLFIFWTQNVLDGLMDSLLNVPGMKHNIWEFRNVE